MRQLCPTGVHLMTILFFLFVVCFGVVMVSICEKSRRADLQEQFPPLSDAEFVARCAPGTDPLVALRVRRILADCLWVEYERIYPSSRLVEDLGAG
jgi:hypothetical protein